MGGNPDSPRWRFRFADIFPRGSKSQEVKSDSGSDITLVPRYVFYFPVCMIKNGYLIESFY